MPGPMRRRSPPRRWLAGAPTAIVEGGGYVPGPVMAYDRAAASGAEVAPVEPGTQQVLASLTVMFAIATGA